MSETAVAKAFDLLDSWGLTAVELSEIVAENPSMRGLMFGFVAEYKVRRDWLLRSEIENLSRPRSHDRKAKGDFKFDYKGHSITLEVKCLDTPKVKTLESGGFSGTFQCNGSDTRLQTLPNGNNVTTNCLVVGEFDVLAVCLHAFGGLWRYAFAANFDLPRSEWKNYKPEDRPYLLKSAMAITWPLKAPFREDLYSVLDVVIDRRATHV